MNHRETLDELRTQVAEGCYEIDPGQVADAIIRHHSDLAFADRVELRLADRSRRHRRISIRRITHRRSRDTPKALAA